MKQKIIFEDRATEKGLRLHGNTNQKEFYHVEVGLHFTAKEGDYMVTEYYHKFNDPTDTRNKTTYGKHTILGNFNEVIDFVTEKYGESNLGEFKRKADMLHLFMFQDKNVCNWKGRKGVVV